jgi:hypothetical protein
VDIPACDDTVGVVSPPLGISKLYQAATGTISHARYSAALIDLWYSSGFLMIRPEIRLALL